MEHIVVCHFVIVIPREILSCPFNKFPTEPKLRKAWLHWIGRADFKPTQYHRVCSKHFEGGKKSWLNNLPTIGPKIIKPTPTKERPTVRCREREKYPIPAPKKRRSSESETVEKLRQEVEELQNSVSELERGKQQQEHEICVLKENIEKRVFSIEHFKADNANFEFYTGFPNYDTFKAFYNYLSPACERLRSC